MKIGIAVRQSLFTCIIKIQVSKYAFTALICISCYNYAYHDFWKKLSCSRDSVHRIATAGMDAGCVANSHGGLILQRWRKQKYFFSESLEQPASDNGADMHKYNMIYT